MGHWGLHGGKLFFNSLGKIGRGEGGNNCSERITRMRCSDIMLWRVDRGKVGEDIYGQRERFPLAT